ncbi:glucosaminidase domain-containing protein [Bacillus sp. FJAT-42376]|uniref:glucosaminidase domain-containing protein n=1 Tax=Bacillus sp. FJAT-42376 TaxID=2014076 RepID=UPI001F150F53|nr:glucosaminidase domain-containing protein [Bacillus sp. FJAT-42376]
MLTSKQMGDYVLLTYPTPKLTSVNIYQLADLYLEIGRKEGVRGDIAFAQAVHETGFFKFGGDVVPEQNNYAGIGTTGGGVKGAYFSSPDEGVRAHIQHLKAYASTEPLNTVLADPRFNLVKRGIAPLWSDLNGRWAVPGRGYGEKVLQIHMDMAKMTLAIPNVYLPANHGLPVARLMISSDVDMLNPDGTFYKTVKKDESIRVYGVLGNSYDVGGGYLIEANSSKMGAYIGRALVNNTNTIMYSPDGSVHRIFQKGEALRVYDYDDSRYQVGGGYYISASDKPVYHLGRIKLSADTDFYSPDGTPFTVLNKNKEYRVYGIDGNSLDLGGGYTIRYDKKTMTYIN